MIESVVAYPLANVESHIEDTIKDWSPITTVVEKMIAKKEISGAQILVQHKGKKVYFSSFGMRDIKEKSPIMQDTIFRIYSMTKPITSVAAMMLVEGGQLELDKPVGDYIPELRDMPVYGKSKRKSNTHNMTVRQLMNHTSAYIWIL